MCNWNSCIPDYVVFHVYYYYYIMCELNNELSNNDHCYYLVYILICDSMEDLYSLMELSNKVIKKEI